MTYDSNKIRAILISIIALIGALYLGISSATAQLETVLWVVGGTGLITCALLGRRIWMIIPFFGTINLSLMLPGTPNTMLLAQAIFLGFCVLLFLMRKLPFELGFTELGLWTTLLTICIVQAYLRYPVGLNIFGGSSLGGRPYALFAITLVSSLVFSSLRISAPDLNAILRLSILGGIINFATLCFGHFVPRVGMWVGATAIETNNATGQVQSTLVAEQASRIVFVRDIGRNLANWIGAFVSPIRACLHPLWALLLLLSFVFAAYSGYRNEIAAVGLTYLVALAYRGGRVSLVIAFFTFFTGVIMLALFNLAVPLPANVQRSLSFLPGTWNEVYVKDSEDSTEWRLEMWKEALLTEFWIKNKFLGDGLGMTREEFNYIKSFEGKNIGGAVRTGKLTQQQQFLMACGSYHSGPVSTIRTTGYLGLIILVMAQIRLAVHSHRQILRAKDTEWFPLTLFIGIPLIWSPFFFVFIFGEFGVAAASYLMGAAYVRLLERNLPLPPYVSPRQAKYVPLIARQEKLIQ